MKKDSTNRSLMEKQIILLSFLFFIIILFSCRSRNKNDETSGDLMSVRTLGLAYLEEFKLEEAEKEFLKFIDLAPGDKFGYANLGLTYLRMGKYPEAEKNLLQAVSIDSLDADIRLILSTVYKMNDEPARSVAELKKALSFAPHHVKVLYEISEIYAMNQDQESAAARKNYLQKLIQAAPENLVPRLNYTDILIRSGDTDKAIEQLEILRRQFPEFPKEAAEYYDKAMQSIVGNDSGEAILQFTIFHNYLKVTPPYQAGMMDLKGPGGSLIGFPLITFDRQSSSTLAAGESILDVMKFTEVAEAAGLVANTGGNQRFSEYSLIEAADYDGDEDIDLYAGSYDAQTSTFRHWLFNNNSGRFTDMAEQAGLTHSGSETAAAFGDYDNDGFPDLYIIREDGDILYRNTGEGKFENVTEKANTGSKTWAHKALFLDADHDGDLDLFLACARKNLLFRNNGDETFSELGEQMELAGETVISSDAAFGDFDEDGDLDLIVANDNASNRIYSNQRQSIFRDLTAESGLQSQGGSTRIAAADYNNDGFIDLFIASSDARNNLLYRNSGNGKFEVDENAGDIFRMIRNVRIHDAEFLDFDNDGYADLLISGISLDEKQKGIFLYHNDGKGRFSDVSKMLTDVPYSGSDIAVFDYNDDGDTDIAIAKAEGGISLLRNDGGNNNHYVKIRLVGLRAGSAKNNHFGIGAKVEIRAGDLYQTMVVSQPDILFGIGNRSMADVIRITWTNGVPQNIFYPAADQALIEAQTLKGSCPFLYAWNGNEYAFVKDILWRSGLGMPLGIMGNATAYAFADASDDYLKIPGESLKPAGGKYSIRVTSELWETIYLDKLSLVAVDHPESTDIFVEEQFSPPPFPGLKIFHVAAKEVPVSAVDTYGRDVMHFISEKDDKYLSGYKQDIYQGVTEMKEIVIDPGKTGMNGKLYLFMNGWIFPTDASINVALSQSEKIKVIPPEIQVSNEAGEWETVANAGFPMGKDKTIIVDLSGKFLSKDHRIRVQTNMDIYWDHIFLADELSDAPLSVNKMKPVLADIHYRGFSEGFRKGSRYGPHWFDYSKVSGVSKWRDLTGNYTRYGDVLPLLTSSDNKYIISNAGDEVTIEFDAVNLPPLKKGMKRDFLINSVGWVKDGDINTAFGNTVLPLPFHGMKRYPPSPGDKYPDTEELRRYNQEYNTRIVTRDEYLNALKNSH